ncbi:hypothetical protein GO013_16670 [Pseudodesulfovibrio sp. JC047]|uniref:hypothetical protein n=1 Tax=Pseudodesulfovibrio sp. JC047 TaxID=2683199 RepID=UPI0013D29A05|nr:hypothetical protein [Pseudodesulfovibrio sp. JC047]NDV21042.1 hypothetical protein [Pseudodesulfovibrio sp. JC047]
MARTTMKQLLRAKQMRKVQEHLSMHPTTFKDLKALIARDDERAEIVAMMLTSGMVSATFYLNPLPESEAIHG